MMSNTDSPGGLAKWGLAPVIFLIFLTLKLAGVGAVASWSWVWVTSPLWLPLSVALLFFVLAVFVAGAGRVWDRLERRSR